MPLYTYKCECGEIQTDLQELKDMNKPEACKKCGSKNRKRYYDSGSGLNILKVIPFVEG